MVDECGSIGGKLASAVRWELDHGKDAERQRERAARTGDPIPRHLWPPKLLPGALPWLQSFWELSTDRQVGMAAGPIPAASIDRHCDRLGMAGDEETAFRRCIRSMDAEFMTSVKGERELSPIAFDKIFGEKG